uniref:CCDC92/74 N-terminal domain-containing protein n=1 Tax=Strigamia maritima TaxID=126957 RepID=T1J6I8_STRMM
MNTAVQEKPPPPIQFISPLPAVIPQSSAIWSANSRQINDGTRYRKSARKSQKRQSSVTPSCEPHIPPEFQDGVGGASMEPTQTILRLERNIKFLKEQHAIVLSSLHKEIEQLKGKTKLVMGEEISDKSNGGVVNDEQNSDGSVSRSSSVSSVEKSMRISDLKRQMAVLEDENRVLLTALSDAKNKNLFLTSRFEQMKIQTSGQQNQRSKPHSSLKHNEIPVMYSQRLDDLDEMLQQQKRENIELQIELNRLKTMIREILSSSKWSSEAYGIARAILQEGNHGHDRKNQRLPRIPLRPHEPQRL